MRPAERKGGGEGKKREREDRIEKGTERKNRKGKETKKAKGTLPTQLARFSSLP